MRTSKERKELHIKLFTLMAEQGWYKPTCLTEMGIPKDEWPVLKCFACEEAGQEKDFSKEKCINCPIKWPGGDCESDESPYGKVRNDMGTRADNPSYYSYALLKDAAKQILKLPFRFAWAEEEKMEEKVEKQVMLQGYLINVGDRVWHRDLEWREVISIELNHQDNRPIKIDGGLRYREDGRHSKDDPLPSIFWQPIEVFLPPKPKKKVKRQVVVKGVRWAELGQSVVPYSNLSGGLSWIDFLNKSPMEMTLEWEEE